MNLACIKTNKVFQLRFLSKVECYIKMRRFYMLPSQSQGITMSVKKKTLLNPGELNRKTFSNKRSFLKVKRKAGLHRMTRRNDGTCEIRTTVCKRRPPAISNRKWKYLPGMISNNGLECGYKVMLGERLQKNKKRWQTFPLTRSHI